jgi:hypothetical protein
MHSPKTNTRYLQTLLILAILGWNPFSEKHTEREPGRARYLVDHFVLEDLLLVDDFDGHAFTGLLVLGDLHLGKSAFSKSIPELIFPDPRARATC